MSLGESTPKQEERTILYIGFHFFTLRLARLSCLVYTPSFALARRSFTISGTDTEKQWRNTTAGVHTSQGN
jgi:hypothetical protein